MGKLMVKKAAKDILDSYGTRAWRLALVLILSGFAWWASQVWEVVSCMPEKYAAREEVRINCAKIEAEREKANERMMQIMAGISEIKTDVAFIKGQMRGDRRDRP